METQHLKVHPKVLENLSKIPKPTARRMLKKWFTHGECDKLMRMAGCPDKATSLEHWLYQTHKSPFLIYES